MHKWQAYLSLFAEEIADGFEERYMAYRATIVDPKLKCKGRWSFTMQECKRRLAEASEDVLQQVEKRREEALAAANAISLVDKDGNPISMAEAQEKAFKLQR